MLVFGSVGLSTVKLSIISICCKFVWFHCHWMFWVDSPIKKERCVMANQPTPTLIYPPPEIARPYYDQGLWKPLVYLTVMFGHISKTLISFRKVLPQNLTWNLKMMVSKRNLLFQGLLFRFHVKFQGGTLMGRGVGRLTRRKKITRRWKMILRYYEWHPRICWTGWQVGGREKVVLGCVFLEFD